MSHHPASVEVLDSVDRLLHGLAALGVLGALATGVVAESPALAAAAGLDHRVVRAAHGAFGAAAVAAWVLHGVRLCLAWLGGESTWGLMPRWRDLGAFGRALGWGLGLARERPAWGRFSYRERVPYGLQLVLLPALAGTGWLVAHPAWGVGLLGAQGLVQVAALHAAGGALLVPVVLWHLFFAHGQPGALFWNGAWIHGRAPWWRVERLRPGWARELGTSVTPVAGAAATVDVEALLDRGNRAAREHRWAEAEAAYREALEVYPGYAQALFNLGVVRARAGDRRGAREALESFVAKDPFGPAADRAREVLRQLGEEDESRG